MLCSCPASACLSRTTRHRHRRFLLTADSMLRTYVSTLSTSSFVRTARSTSASSCVLTTSEPPKSRTSSARQRGERLRHRAPAVEQPTAERVDRATQAHEPVLVVRPHPRPAPRGLTRFRAAHILPAPPGRIASRLVGQGFFGRRPDPSGSVPAREGAQKGHRRGTVTETARKLPDRSQSSP